MNAALKGLVIVVFLLALLAVIAWRSPDDTVEAKCFILRDSKGAERGTWKMNESVKGADSPTLRLFGRGGKDAISISALDSGPGIALYDEHGKHRVSISYEDGQDCEITLFDGNGKSRIKLQVDKTDAVRVETTDKDGNVDWTSSK